MVVVYVRTANAPVILFTNSAFAILLREQFSIKIRLNAVECTKSRISGICAVNSRMRFSVGGVANHLACVTIRVSVWMPSSIGLHIVTARTDFSLWCSDCHFFRFFPPRDLLSAMAIACRCG